MLRWNQSMWKALPGDRAGDSTFSWAQNELGQRFSRCGPQTWGVTREFVSGACPEPEALGWAQPPVFRWVCRAVPRKLKWKTADKGKGQEQRLYLSVECGTRAGTEGLLCGGQCLPT